MTDEQLKYILDGIELVECEELRKNHIYYIQKDVRQRVNRGEPLPNGKKILQYNFDKKFCGKLKCVYGRENNPMRR